VICHVGGVVAGGGVPAGGDGLAGELERDHRGRYRYISALRPGYREPAPILHLRYQGSAGRWAIGIYLASSGRARGGHSRALVAAWP
jgi:hypothetical protein